MKRRNRILLLVCVILILLSPSISNFCDNVSHNKSCTVLIETQYEGFFGTSYSIGSGVIIDANGTIITAKHCVADVNELQVTVYGKIYDVNIVYLSPDTDIAKIELDINTPNFAVIGDSNDLKKWDVVYSIGNAEGIWDNKLSIGYIYKNHFKRMFLNGVDYIFAKIHSFPGCSGGGVYRGRDLIGIVVAGMKNITFVLSSNEIKDFLEKPTQPTEVGGSLNKEK